MKKPTRKQLTSIGILLLFAGLFAWGLKAEAAEVTFGIGVGEFSNDGARSMNLRLSGDSRTWYAGVARVGGDDRNDYEYNRWTAGYRVNFRKETNFSPYMRFGAAYFSEEPTDYISDQLAFDLAIGVRFWQVFELERDHQSTGGRTDQNEGIDSWNLNVVYRF